MALAAALSPIATLPTAPTEAFVPKTEARAKPLSVALGPTTVEFAVENAFVPNAIALMPFAWARLPCAMAPIELEIVLPTWAPSPMAMPFEEAAATNAALPAPVAALPPMAIELAAFA